MERRSEDDDSTSTSTSDSHTKKRSRKKRDRKKTDKKKSKHRHRDRDDEQRRESKKQKSPKMTFPSSKPDKDKSLLHPMGEPLGHLPVGLTLIDPEQDYFTFHQPFWVYLYREEGVAFNDLTSEEAHAAFQTFAHRYNTGNLEEPYYSTSTFPPEVLEQCRTTQHTWAFQTTETERKGLDVLQQGVRRQTEYIEKKNTASNSNAATEASKPSMACKAPSATPATEDEDRFRHKTQTPQERLEDRQSNRRLREHVRNAEEELSGGSKDILERHIEKRKEKGAKMHGASQDKEEGAGQELSDANMYGQDQSYKVALGRERRSKANRQERQASRIEEMENKERQRQETMLKMLGLEGIKPGQKITMAPRKDG
jgi:hypothetical protein